MKWNVFFPSILSLHHSVTQALLFHYILKCPGTSSHCFQMRELILGAHLSSAIKHLFGELISLRPLTAWVCSLSPPRLKLILIKGDGGCTLPVSTVSLEESATCCTASWAACTANRHHHHSDSQTHPFGIHMQKKYFQKSEWNLSDYLYLLSPWPPLRLIGWSLLGSQKTSWTRPWLLPLSLQRPHIRLSWQQLEWLFNTLCSSPTPQILHVPVGLTRTKLTQRGPITLASQLWQCRAEGQSTLSRFYTSTNQTPPDTSEQKKKETCEASG